MPPKPLHYRIVKRKLEKAGYQQVGQTGSHVKFVKEENRGKTTVMVPYRRGDVKVGTLKSVLRQAGIAWDDFNNL